MKHTIDSLKQRTRDEDDCWLWEGAKAGKGYPVVGDDRERYVHRLVLLLSGRQVPAGMQAAHRCGKSLCINPDHIYAATQQQNEHDKSRHGTARRGVPGKTHCGKYVPSGRCKRRPHRGSCDPDVVVATAPAEGARP